MSDRPSSKPRAPLRLDQQHPLLSASFDTVDGARFLLPLAVAGLLAAAALAVVGLPTVDLHGPLHRLGVMDPFCGENRALRLTARGDLALGSLEVRQQALAPMLMRHGYQPNAPSPREGPHDAEARPAAPDPAPPPPPG